MSERIKERRIELHLNVAEVAAKCRVSKSAVYQWESGDTKRLKGDTLLALSELLKTHEKWLSTGSGPKVKALRADELTVLETEFLADFRELTTDQQIGMKTVVSTLAEQRRKKKRGL